jgi:hypothetical protein
MVRGASVLPVVCMISAKVAVNTSSLRLAALPQELWKRVVKRLERAPLSV